MATRAATLINAGYGRGLASLRTLLDLSGIEFADAVREWFGKDAEGKWIFPLTQPKLSAIETGRQPLKLHEMEMLIAFFSEALNMRPDAVHKRLRPHQLGVVRGSSDPVSSAPIRTTKGGYLTTPAEITRLNPATYPDRIAS